MMNGIMIPIVIMSAGATMRYGRTLVLNGNLFRSGVIELPVLDILTPPNLIRKALRIGYYNLSLNACDLLNLNLPQRNLTLLQGRKLGQ